MPIAGYLQTSLIEWPGKIAAVIFVPGCNLRCPFCHNADLVLPEKIEKVSLLPAETVLTDLERRKKWVDGVVVTGGEPTLQGGLEEFLRFLKEGSLEVMLESNGTRPEVMERLLAEKLLDKVVFDYKLDWESYGLLGSNAVLTAKIKKSYELVWREAGFLEVRTTLVPGWHTQERLLKMALELRKMWFEKGDKKEVKWFLQCFQPSNCLAEEFRHKEAFGRPEAEKLRKELKKTFKEAEINLV